MLELELEEDQEERTRCTKCLAGCRTVTTFFLSHVGLISLVIAYCVLGAFTFESLEKQHELDVSIICFYVGFSYPMKCKIMILWYPVLFAKQKRHLRAYRQYCMHLCGIYNLAVLLKPAVVIM